MAAAATPLSKDLSPPRVSGGWPLLGHLLELRRDPLAFMRRVREECGEIGEFNMAGNEIVLMSGNDAQEAFFRAPDEQLDQAAAYPFMKPVFGEGVVFDATPEQRKQAMRNQSLRDKFMRGHAEHIAAEVEAMIEGWGESGEIDALDFFSELTLYTSSTCLVGKQFRDELAADFVPLFYDLERGTDALAYVNPYLPIPALRARDRARKDLVKKIEAIFARRDREGGEYTDLFHVLRGVKDEHGKPRYTPAQITGMFISMMFAGHHTSSAVASWTLLDLLMHPEWMRKVTGELDAIYADGRDVSFQALREIPTLECAIKESLRLHPPLTILMRKVMYDFRYGDYLIPAGKTVAASTVVSHRLPEHFPNPDAYDPERYLGERAEDRQPFAWIPFGAGRHKCVGAAFALMQLKAIFSIVLREYEFELAQPMDSYGNDLSKLVVAVKQPCMLRYRRRKAAQVAVSAQAPKVEETVSTAPFRVVVDPDLCQGHAVCMGEAPEVFDIERVNDEDKVALIEEQPAAELRAKVERAVKYCPTQALRIEDVP